MREPEDNQLKLVFRKADGGVIAVAASAVAGATYLGLNAKANVAAILAFTAAIFVALLSAYWTQRRLNQELAAADQQQARQLAAETARQAQQLDAETQRQAQQLEAEADRLRLQLAHDRQLHDLSELRSVLDDAVAAVEVARNSFTHLGRVYLREPYDEDEGRVVYDDLMMKRRSVEKALARITVRGQDELARALLDFDRALTPPTVNPGLPDKTPVRVAVEQAHSKLAARQADFLARARALVPSHLPAGFG